MGLALRIYSTNAFQNRQGFNAAARTPHEARMGGILGEWRENLDLRRQCHTLVHHLLAELARRLCGGLVRDHRVHGYEVTYRYRGEVYRTTTDYHPGDRIRIRVDVTPLG